MLSTWLRMRLAIESHKPLTESEVCTHQPKFYTRLIKKGLRMRYVTIVQQRSRYLVLSLILQRKAMTRIKEVSPL